jgi:SAM-dependent methyltransferase
MKEMNVVTQRQLLELNRTFYIKVTADFDRTRGGLVAGWQPLLKYIPTAKADEPIWVLDVGCGNGRFARALEQKATPLCYVGVDADPTLLALAADHTADLVHTQVSFVQASLDEPGWSKGVHTLHDAYAIIVCFATLHHFPSFSLRLRVMQEMASLLAPDGLLLFSNWQFLTSERFVQKQIDWREIGLSVEDVEPGDALLPWQQGGYAIRYVHQIDALEMERLASATGLKVIDSFYADGKEGNLNLYSVLSRE